MMSYLTFDHESLENLVLERQSGVILANALVRELVRLELALVLDQQCLLPLQEQQEQQTSRRKQSAVNQQCSCSVVASSRTFSNDLNELIACVRPICQVRADAASTV